ncbi:MAG: lipopolysaccharide transport periplasmic protein LptA [Sideroxydans sp.]|nr:lipopolysaccharide transport periplasmic protein LptA [Sideroxydans sp.]
MNRFANKFCLLCLLLLSSTNLAFAERADRDKPLHLEANRVVVDDAKQRSSFEGEVRLTQGTLLIQADKIDVTEDAQGFQHLNASGSPAKFWQRFEGSNEYAEGYGERIEYDTRTDSVDFFGRARVKRGQDEVSGAHITYSTKTEVFEVRGNASSSSKAPTGDGRVHAVIQPKSKPANSNTSKDALTIQPSPALSPSATDSPEQKHE